MGKINLQKKTPTGAGVNQLDLTGLYLTELGFHDSIMVTVRFLPADFA